jgi:hypothetical protein
MVRNSLTHVGVVAAGAVLMVGLAACGSNPGNSAQPAPSPTTNSSAAASSSASTTPASTMSPAVVSPSSPPPPPNPGNGLCKAADISLALGRGDAGAGTVNRPLVMTNVSDHQCTIGGFPGISYVAGADGHQVGKDASRTGTTGDVIILSKGESAAANVGFVNVRNYDAAECKPTDVKGLRVYLPQETASKFVDAPGIGCASDKIPGNQLTVQTVHRGSGQ